LKTTASVLLGTVASFSLLTVRAEKGPTLEVLPLNSTLSDVTIPRYDENLRRVGYLKAELMEILADGEPVDDRQPIMVDCTGIQLRMETKEAGGDIKVDMERARYRMTPGVLTVKEAITARSPKFNLSGTGGVFHLDSQRGFIYGPLSCDIFQFQTVSHTEMLPSLPILPVLLATTSLVTLNPGFQPPTSERLLEVTQAAKPSSSQIQSQQLKVAEASNEHEEEAGQARNKLAEFANDVDSKSLNLLIQNPPAPNPAAQARPPLENPELEIECDGGCFFDGNENLLVLLRNIVVNEKRFTLKAQEEIKVFFNTAPAPKKEGEEGAKKEEEEEAKDEADKGPSLNLTDVKSLVATGGVNFTGVDKNGNPVEASAETAFYDDEKQELILKGGQPTFWMKQQEREFHFQAEDTNAFVRIELANEVMSAHTSPTGWKFGGKGLRKKQN
jgi:lipopolysaccharide export system protein LptA